MDFGRADVQCPLRMTLENRVLTELNDLYNGDQALAFDILQPIRFWQIVNDYFIHFHKPLPSSPVESLIPFPIPISIQIPS